MELNPSTFFLEILNFLVLVWILKRFLYQPVLDAIAQRRAAVEQTLNAAQATRSEAEALQAQYENRLSQWSTEREAARESLRREIAEERQRMLAIVEQELQREREKNQVLDEKLRADSLRKCQEAALSLGTRFTARLLADLAGPDVHLRLVDLAVLKMGELDEAQRNAIRLACEETTEEAEVATAYPLDVERRRQFAEALNSLLGMPVACRYAEDPTLLAGVRVTLGPWVFGANLQDELKSFAACVHESA
jgi:F-type H+-transporting ATPase subunit b